MSVNFSRGGGMRLFYIVMFCVLGCLAIFLPAGAAETREFGQSLATVLQRDAGELVGAPLLQKARLTLLCLLGGDAVRIVFPAVSREWEEGRGSQFFVSKKDGFVTPRDR